MQPTDASTSASKIVTPLAIGILLRLNVRLSVAVGSSARTCATILLDVLAVLCISLVTVRTASSGMT